MSAGNISYPHINYWSRIKNRFVSLYIAKRTTRTNPAGKCGTQKQGYTSTTCTLCHRLSQLEPEQRETERLRLQMGESLPPVRAPIKVSRGIDGHKKSRPESLLFLALFGPRLAPAKEEYGVAMVSSAPF